MKLLCFSWESFKSVACEISFPHCCAQETAWVWRHTKYIGLSLLCDKQFKTKHTKSCSVVAAISRKSPFTSNTIPCLNSTFWEVMRPFTSNTFPCLFNSTFWEVVRVGTGGKIKGQSACLTCQTSHCFSRVGFALKWGKLSFYKAKLLHSLLLLSLCMPSEWRRVLPQLTIWNVVVSKEPFKGEIWFVCFTPICVGTFL